MLNNTVPERITSLSHPLVREAYLKKDFGTGHKDKDVLVIETLDPDFDDIDHELFDSYLIDLLVDLGDLKNQAEQKVGSFDRVDIRY